ncbi:MAG: hypothetical protein K2Y37_16845 [Pirellulales bacterium]|nr:hypothetical protein [Pirellulales bacterium]
MAADPSVVVTSVQVPELATVFSGVALESADEPLPRHADSIVDLGHLHCSPDADLVVVFRCLLI